jgi:hypothetical protein
MNQRDVLSGLFWLALSVFVCSLSFQAGIGTLNSPSQGFLPFWSGIALGIFAISLVIKSFLKRKVEETITSLWKEMEWRTVILVLGSLLAYALLLTRIGYILTTFGLLILLSGIMRGSRLWIRVVGSLITTLVTYVIFYVWFSVQLPSGILGF